MNSIDVLLHVKGTAICKNQADIKKVIHPIYQFNLYNDLNYRFKYMNIQKNVTNK